MSRLSEALRRAGQADDRQSSPEGDEEQFTAGEDGRDELDDQEPAPESPRAEIEAVAQERVPDIRHLVPRPRAFPGAPAAYERPDDIQIRDVIQVVLRRKWLICAVVATALGVAAAYNHLARPVYQGRARVLVERDLAQVMPFRSVTEDTMGVEYFVTQFDVLRSRGLARRTLEQMNVLSGDPAAQSSQINQLLGALTITPVKSELGPSRVINVAVNSERPELAAQLANAHAKAYVQQNLEQRRSGNQEASKWLNERLSELRHEMTKAAGALQQYRESKDALSLEGGQNIVGQKLAQLNMTLTTVRAEKLQKEAIYQQLKAIQETGAPLDTFPPISANGYIQGLKQDLATQQRERGRLSEQFGDQHPEMIKISATVAATERKLNEEMNKVVQSVLADYKVTEAQESALSKALDDQKREVLALDQKSIVYGALERDAKSSEQIFDSVLQRLKETELSGELQTNNVRILDSAETPRAPILPRTRFNLALALAIGCVLAAALVAGLEYLHPRITRPQEIRDSLRLPVLGITPKVSVWKGALKVDRLPPAFQEAMRGVRTTLLLSARTPIPRTLAVTSTTVGEGKTAVASSLAVSMAAAGRRVLLVDADMRRSQVHRMFNVPLSPGLADVLTGDAKPSEALLESNVSGLFILPGGTSKAGNMELLDSERLTHLIRGFSQVFDLVLLDCPPVMAVADASIIANAASGVVFVVGSGITSHEAAQAAVDRLNSVQARVVGVILNKAKSDRPGYANPYYYQTQDIA